MPTITLDGPIPSKKNLKKPGLHGGVPCLVHDKSVQAQIDWLILQARTQWRGRAPLTSPEITVYLRFPRMSQDQDNAYTTILDVLCKAGVLANDNAKQNNGWKHLAPVERGAPGARIELVEASC